jgi:hypothetical protein
MHCPSVSKMNPCRYSKKKEVKFLNNLSFKALLGTGTFLYVITTFSVKYLDAVPIFFSQLDPLAEIPY